MEIVYIQVQTQRRRTCMQKEVQIITVVIIVQTQECMETQYTRRAQTVTRATDRGTAITLTFLTRANLSSNAGEVTAMVPMLACSISATAMAIASTAARSVRSW